MAIPGSGRIAPCQMAATGSSSPFGPLEGRPLGMVLFGPPRSGKSSVVEALRNVLVRCARAAPAIAPRPASATLAADCRRTLRSLVQSDDVESFADDGLRVRGGITLRPHSLVGDEASLGEAVDAGLTSTPEWPVHAVVLVLDSSSAADVAMLRLVLDRCVRHGALAATEKQHGAPLLVFANKMDAEDAQAPFDIVAALDGMADITDRAWHVTACNAATGFGVADGFRWLAERYVEAEAGE